MAEHHVGGDNEFIGDDLWIARADIAIAFYAVELEDGLNFTRARQGSNGSSWIWKLITRFILAPLVAKWYALGWGVHIECCTTGASLLSVFC